VRPALPSGNSDPKVKQAEIASVLILVVLASLVFVLQSRPPIPPSHTHFPYPGFDHTTWANSSLLEVQQVGRVETLASGDIDGDGSIEIVAVGTYSSGLGDIRVLRYQDSNWETLAAYQSSWPGFWDFKSVGLFDLDGDGRKEIIAGGTVHVDEGEGNAGFQAFRWLGNGLVRVGEAFWQEGLNRNDVLGILPAVVGTPDDTAFMTFSFEQSRVSGAGTYLRAWRWNAGPSQFEQIASFSFGWRFWSARTFPCTPSIGKAQGVFLGGIEVVTVLEGKVAGGFLPVLNKSTPDVQWFRSACVDDGNTTTFASNGNSVTANHSGSWVLGIRASRSENGSWSVTEPVFRPLDEVVGGLPQPEVTGVPAVRSLNDAAEVIVPSALSGEAGGAPFVLRVRIHFTNRTVELVGEPKFGTGFVVYSALFLHSQPGGENQLVLAGIAAGDPFVAIAAD